MIFKNLKVVELASVLAGPSVGMFFAELGATVIKIENKKTGGDVTRSWKLPTENPKEKTSAYYVSVNWGKQSLFLDLTDKKDLQKVYSIIKSADIVIANYKSGDAKKLKMDYTTLKKLNPKLIYGNIVGFGENDSRVAYDLVLQAETGFMSMNGTKESGPVKMPVALIDLLAAHQMKEAILIALLNRERTKKGCKINVSLYDSAISSLANQASNWLNAKHNPERIGSLHPNIAPYGEIFISKDKVQFVLAIGSDKQFNLLYEILGNENLETNTSYKTNSLRVKNRTKLQSELQKSISKKTFTFLKKSFLKNNIPFGEIKSVKDVFEDKKAQKNILKNHNLKEINTVKSAVFQIV